MLNKILKINNSDNVITALSDLKKGEEVQWNGNLFLIKDNIAAKHKFFEKDMQAAEEIIMYGVLVGKTQVAVNAGSLMTTENVKHAAQPYAYRKKTYCNVLAAGTNKIEPIPKSIKPRMIPVL